MSEPSAKQSTALAGAALLAAAVAICIASMLMRAPVTCIGPIADEIMRYFGVSHTEYGVLAALPIAAFGVFSFFAAPLGARCGIKYAILVSLLILAVGAAARPVNSWTVFLLASLVVGAGIALLNVIVPVAIKSWFGPHTAAMMGLYTGLVGLSGSIGGLTAVPIMHAADGLHGTLLAWAAAAVLAALLWFVLAPGKRTAKAARTANSAAPTPARRLLKSPTAVALIFVMGLQSMLIYTVSAWLPPFLTAGGMPEQQAGFWLFIYLVSGLPASIFTPALMRFLNSEVRTALLLGALYLAGVAGWLAGGVWLLPASISAGASQGAMLSVAMLLMARKSASSGEMLAISALAQRLGYIGACFGPVVFGTLLEASSWFAGFSFVDVIIAAWSAAGLAASRSSHLL